MQSIEIVQKYNLSMDHINKIHRGNDGYISIAQIVNGKWIEKFYKKSELQAAIGSWTGNDIYISQNVFKTKQRRLENVKLLENLYIDIDCYKEDFTAEHALSSVIYLSDQKDIPRPNLIIKSGRGLQIIWYIKHEDPDKAPMWQQVEDWLCNELKHLGSDVKAKDASRVLRLCGSFHSENGNMVTYNELHDEIYNVDELYELYVKDRPYEKEIEKVVTKSNKSTGRPANLKHLFTLHKLFWSRINDIWNLVSMRNGHCENCREMLLFLYRYHSCCFTSDPRQALEDTLSLNKRLRPPLPEHTVITATKSAERAFLNDRKYRYKTQTVVEMLNTTDEEQTKMTNLIGKQEKYRRKNIKRNTGANADKFKKVLDIYEKGTTGIKAIARETGVSIDTVRKYLNIIRGTK